MAKLEIEFTHVPKTAKAIILRVTRRFTERQIENIRKEFEKVSDIPVVVLDHQLEVDFLDDDSLASLNARVKELERWREATEDYAQEQLDQG